MSKERIDPKSLTHSDIEKMHKKGMKVAKECHEMVDVFMKNTKDDFEERKKMAIQIVEKNHKIDQLEKRLSYYDKKENEKK